MELLLKLTGPVIPVAAALIQLGRESGWLSRGTLGSRRWTFALIGTIILGGAVTSAMTWHTHESANEERQRNERIATEREQQAQNQRREITEAIKDIELALEREHDPDLTPQEALSKIGIEVNRLREQALKLKQELEGLRRYGRVAQMDVTGMIVIGGGTVGIETEISESLNGGYETIDEEEGKRYQARCDEQGRSILETAAILHPEFPFAHAWIAECLRKEQDPRWRIHANRAMTILNHTTQIAGHHPHHSQMRRILARTLEEQ